MFGAHPSGVTNPAQRANPSPKPEQVTFRRPKLREIDLIPVSERFRHNFSPERTGVEHLTAATSPVLHETAGPEVSDLSDTDHPRRRRKKIANKRAAGPARPRDE